MEFAQLDKLKQSLWIEGRRVRQFKLSCADSDHPEWDLQSLLLGIFDSHSTIW